MSGASAKNEQQMKAPRVTPLEGVSTYALRGIRVRGVENLQGFGIDEHRFIVPGLNQRITDSLRMPAQKAVIRRLKHSEMEWYLDKREKEEGRENGFGDVSRGIVLLISYIFS